MIHTVNSSKNRIFTMFDLFMLQPLASKYVKETTVLSNNKKSKIRQTSRCVNQINARRIPEFKKRLQIRKRNLGPRVR